MSRKIYDIRVLLVILLIILITINFIIYFYNLNLINSNDKLLKKFEEYGQLDAKGSVNLSNLELEENELKLKLLDTFNVNSIKSINYDELLTKLNNDNDDLKLNIKKINSDILELENKNSSLLEEYNVVYKKYVLLYSNLRGVTSGSDSGETYLILDFPTINQYPSYPTGCESVALTIFLKYYDIDVSVDDVISRLKKGSLPYSENGILYGGNPYLEFIGNPYSYSSYGVYNDPIADVSNYYKNGAISKSNISFDEVLNIVKNGKPVVVWNSINLSLPKITSSWIYKPTGEKINWIANEHAVVLIGYNNNYVIISDPIDGTIKYQNRYVFEQRYNSYGKRVVYYD